MERVPFPRDVDAPQRFLLWTVDQFMVFAVFLGIGIFSHALFTCIVIGIVCSWGFTRWRDSKPDGFLVHMAYWYGVIVPKKLRSVPNPFIRRIYPT